MHIGEKFSGVAQARLNFIEHQQHAILPADCFGFPQESLRRKHDAGLPLCGLAEKRAGICCDRLEESGRIPIRNHTESRCKGPEARRYCSSLEKLIAVTVRPWKFPAQTMISACPSGMPLQV
jgi:hypothetical protein